MKKLFQSITLISLAILVLAACAPAINLTVVPTLTPQLTPTQIVSREAQVQSVAIQITNSTPAQVNAVVRGNLTESCATLGEGQVHYESNAFQVTVYVNSPANIGCAQVTTPFETTIRLNTQELPAGSYTVTVNGVSAVFTLPVENPTPTSEPASVDAPTSSTCIDSAAFVADVTIPDNSIVDANTAFTKTWRLKNTGSCTWDSSYLVSYISGMSMTQALGYLLVPQGQTVSPGQTVDIGVGMTSPVENGFYRSNWGLQRRNGPFLPIQGGANGNSFYVKIRVNNGSGSGSVTAASIGIDLEQGSGAVCAANSTYFVHAHMTTDGPTTVSYEIDSSAGQIPAGYFQNSVTNELSTFVTGTLVFDQADTKTISFRFVGPYPLPDDITVLLWVNRGEWYSAKLSC
jgi:Ig-like domain from next to BRCA1 gene